MKIIIILLSLFILIGCNQCNPNIEHAPATPPDESILPIPPQIKTVNGTVNVPELILEEIIISTLTGSTNINSNGTFTNLKTIDGGVSQTIFLKNASGSIVGTAYIPANNVINGNFIIGHKELALGLIKLNPFLMVLNSEQETEVLNRSCNHIDFPSLVTDIRNAMSDSPENTLDYAIHPEIFHKAMAIGIDVIKNYDGETYSMRVAYSNLSRSTSFTKTIGDTSEAYLGDIAGPEFILVNPKQTFYGTSINTMDFLLKGKGGLFDWFTPTDPYEKILNLGNGTFDIIFFKGFNTSETTWLNPLEAQGKATYANSLKMFGIFMKIFGLVSPGTSNLSLTDDQILLILSLDNLPNMNFTKLVSDINIDPNWKKLLTITLPTYIQNHWKEIMHLVYTTNISHLTEDTTTLNQINNYIQDIGDLLPMISQALVAIEAANEWIPFFYDLVKAPSKIQYNIKQTEGVISKIITIPNAPSNFIATPTSPLQAHIEWQDNSNNEDGFRVETWGPISGEWKWIGTNVTWTSGYWNFPISGQEWQLQVRSFNEAGCSKWINTTVICPMF